MNTKYLQALVPRPSQEDMQTSADSERDMRLIELDTSEQCCA